MALSSLFGIGGARQRPATTQVVQSSKLPEEISPYAKEVLDEAKELYKQRMEAGYDPYTGATIAPLTPEQREAYTGIKGLVGTTAPLQREALEGIRGGRERFDYGRLDPLTGDYGRIDERLGPLDPTDFTKFQEKDVTEYMSPYERAVTRTEKREAQRDFERRIMPEFEARATEAGGMSGLGTRAGVEASELARQHAQRLGDIETSGLQRAYQDAQARRAEDFQRFQDQRSFEERQRSFGEREREFARGERAFGVGERAYAADLEKGEREFMRGERTFDAQQFAAQKAREAAVAQQVGAMGPAMFTSGLAEQGALQTIGEQKQNLGQQALDEAYFRHLEKQAFPQEQLAGYSGFVYGNPLMQQRDVTATGTQVGSKPSLGQQILGLGMQGLNKYANPGPTMPQYVDSGAANRGVRLGVKGGGYLGGLSSLPVVRRAENGGISTGVNEVIERIRDPDFVPDKSEEDRYEAARKAFNIFSTLKTGPEHREKTAEIAQKYRDLIETRRPPLSNWFDEVGDALVNDPDSQGFVWALSEGTRKYGNSKKDFEKLQFALETQLLQQDLNTEEVIASLPDAVLSRLNKEEKRKLANHLTKAKIGAEQRKERGKPISKVNMNYITEQVANHRGYGSILTSDKTAIAVDSRGKSLTGPPMKALAKDIDFVYKAYLSEKKKKNINEDQALEAAIKAYETLRGTKKWQDSKAKLDNESGDPKVVSGTSERKTSPLEGRSVKTLLAQ